MNELTTKGPRGSWLRRRLGMDGGDGAAAGREHGLPLDSEERYRMLTEHMKDVVWMLDADTLRYRYASPSFLGVLGYTPAEAMAFERADHTLLPEDRNRFGSMLRKRCAELRGGQTPPEEYLTLELQQQRKDGSRLWTECVLHFQLHPESDRIDVQGVVRDISGRKLSDLYHGIDIEVLRTFESSEPMDTLFERACGLICENTELDGVGIRMRSVDDCPYVALAGTLRRNGMDLVVRDMTGNPVRDSRGAAHLQCLCGVVMGGNPQEKAGEWATEGGTVWANDVSGLMELPCVFGRDAFCVKEGTGSIALVPIVEKSMVAGILQLVDHRTGRFTPEVITILERIAGHIGEALLRRRAERDFRLLFNGMVEGFSLQEMIFDANQQPADFRFLAVNPQFEHMTGLKRSAVEGRKASEMLGGGEMQWIPVFGKVAATGDPQTFRHTMESTGKHFEITAFEPASGQVAAVFNDITARVLAETERERLSQAIEQSGEMVMITDASAGIVYVNPMFCRCTGYSREEVLGENPRFLKSGLAGAEFYREMWDALTSGRTWTGEVTNRRKNGTYFIERMTISSVFNEAGKIIHYVAVKLDISELRKSEEENRVLQEMLQQTQKMDSIGLLAGGIAHDFNNMLQAIVGYTEHAIKSAPAEPSVLKDLLEIQGATRHSTVLVKQLQAFARKQSIVPKAIDLNGTMGGMLGVLHRMVGDHIQIEWTPDTEPCQVYMDPSQIDQILTNLCVNARDAMGRRGHIHVRTGHTVVSNEDAALTAEGIEPGRYVELSVSDDGCGMPPEVLGRIYEPFFTTKKDGEGTGLGLPTVYGIVKQNKGSIHVDSAPGQGTMFRIFLPEHAETVQPAAKDAPKTAPTGAGETILVVEDESFILNATRRMLESLGYMVLPAGSPAQGLDLFEKNVDAIDLVLSDVIMPGMSGPEAVEKMLAKCPGTKVVYMSGYTANLLVQHGVDETDENFLTKPFSRFRLAEAVRAALDG